MLQYGNYIDVLDSFAIVNSPNKFNPADEHLWVNLNTCISSAILEYLLASQ
jgi:hypothetical protein